MRAIELLAPAANAEIAIAAITHGADAVYIGGPGYGARKSASNSIEDIKRVVDHAHIFHARVYVTVNTIIYEHEIKDVEEMIRQLYLAGVDAVIIQDMGILRMNIPPIALHASTQCNTRTVEKAKFLEAAGFSQIVLARELTIGEIKDICSSVSIPVECFVHGALCVSYSGQCHASCYMTGRSANRGECSQICRLPFTLRDADGTVIAKNQHLLSLKDFNTIDILEELLECGVSSLKIEGRLKDAYYVKNVTAAYSKRLDEII
ncbi:MAG: U32 family peptidase, partial [Muribaculaceae bacterium]|nr:U32 family peptidase [Muribaculaceae bacterium]